MIKKIPVIAFKAKKINKKLQILENRAVSIIV